MVTAVFLCDKEWKIQDVMQYDAKFPILPEEFLTALVDQPEKLMQDAGEHRTLLLGFPDFGMQLSVTIRLFQEGNLVFLAHFVNDQEYIEFAALYEKGLEWAKNHLQGLYHSEYYQISQLNNQLVDSKRALTRANRKLKQAVQEIEKTNERLVEAEKAAEHAMHVAEQANRLKTEFLANMSHDIRTPMNAIVGLSNLMEKDVEKPDKIMNYIEKLQVTSQHLLGLLNDVLDLSKIENGSVSLRMESVNLAAQLRQIEAVTRPQAKACNQTFRIRARGIRHEDFFSDATRLRQVLLNLLSNAVKYTQEGGEILFEMEEFANPDGDLYYRFVVEDNGMGMSEEYLKHIFDPFSRSEESLATEIQGTGLGMAITHNIVEMMDGSITVESSLGKGSRFEVTLPFTPDREKMRTLEGSTVLLIGVSEELEEEISCASGDAAVQIESVDTVSEAVKLMEKKEIDIIIQPFAPNTATAKEQVQLLRKAGSEELMIFCLEAGLWEDMEEHIAAAGMDGMVPLPFFLSRLEKEISRTRKKRKESEDAGDVFTLQGMKLLCAEDNELNAEILGAMLEMAGAAYTICPDGKQLIEAFEAEPEKYDAILMDIQMPVMNGYEAVRRIRSGKPDRGRKIPIIAMTANVFAEDIQKCLNAGMDAHVGKPVDMEVLERTLKKFKV